MSKFESDLIIKALPVKGGRVRWSVYEPFIYIYSKGKAKIIVPIDFVTDFASTPWFLKNIFPSYGKYGKASVIHDYLYSKKIYTRKKCDLIFKDAMKTSGVSRIKIRIIYLAVRMFGWRFYNKSSST